MLPASLQSVLPNGEGKRTFFIEGTNKNKVSALVFCCSFNLASFDHFLVTNVLFNCSERMTIYKFLLDHTADEQRFQLTGKLCQEV